MADMNIGRNVNPDIRTGGRAPTGTPSRVQPTGPELEQIAGQRPQGPQYFGYHDDASISARLAQQGVAPNQVNLRIATQMLRYGLPFSPDALNQFKQLWQGMGSASLVELEALMALFAAGVEADPTNVAAMTQLLSGGPFTHLMAQLTMGLKNSGQVQLQELKNTLASFWKLGNGPEQLVQELPLFQQLMQKLDRNLRMQDPSRLDEELASEFQQLQNHLLAQQLLTRNQSSIYLPFQQWRDQSPLPGELLVETEDNPAFQAAGYAHVMLAIDTRNLGRITMDFTAIRGQLAVKLEVQDLATKQFLERGLPDLRHRLTYRTPYQVASIQCQETGQGRAISLLLPKRRDPRRLSRAIGVI